MNTRVRISILILLLLPIFSVQAQEGAVEKLNARLLPTIWFSALEAKEGETVRVYSAVQNNSGLDFSGTVVFYADKVEIGKVPFVSSTDTLKEVSVEWIAVGGKRTFYAEVRSNLPEGKALLSYKSDESTLDVAKEITFEEVKKETEEVLGVIAEKIDTAAEKLAAKLGSFKTESSTTSPPNPSPSQGGGQGIAEKGQTLSTDSQGLTLGSESGNTLVASAINSAIAAAQFLLSEWKWTLAGAAILALILTFVL